MDLSVYSRRCLEGFNRLRAGTVKAEGQIKFHSDVSGELGRFRIWAENIGALQSNREPSSLAYRLRDCQPVIEEIKGVLEELDDTLQDLHDEFSGTEQHATTEMSSVHQPDVQTITECNELDELLESVRENISSLFKISMILRKATPRDRYKRAELVDGDDFNSQFDIAHVQQKFSKTERAPWLAIRLGWCITKRRRYLRYCRNHREKLAVCSETANVDAEIFGTRKRTYDSIEVPTTDERTISGAESKFAPTSASTLQPEAIAPFDDQETENQSHTSVTTTIVDQDSDPALKVRPLMDVSDGHFDFECPYCWRIQHIKSQRAWQKHVYSDLRAYVCTFERCSDMMFMDANSWITHEFDTHRQEWSCQFCQNTYDSENDFHKHITAKHSSKASSTQLSSLTQTALRSKEEVGADECPFCDDWENSLRLINDHIPEDQQIFVPRKQFRRHVGRHLEQLALFAITPHIEETEEEALGGSNDAAAAFNERDRLGQSKGEHGLSAFDDADIDEEAPLHFAAANGLLEEVKLLLDQGEDPNSRNGDGLSVVELADTQDHQAIVEYLCEKGATTPRPAHEIRKHRPCLRCKFLKKTCDKKRPCTACMRSQGLYLQVPCTTVDIKDMGYFLNGLCFEGPFENCLLSGTDFEGLPNTATQLAVRHGSHQFLHVFTRTAPMIDDDRLGLSWTEFIDGRLREFRIARTQPLYLRREELSRSDVEDYVRRHVCADFGEEPFQEIADQLHIEGTSKESDCDSRLLKSIWRYYKQVKEPVLERVLSLYVAFSMIRRPMMMITVPGGNSILYRVNIPGSRYNGQMLAPGMVDKAIKHELSALWRSYQDDVLEQLSSLFSAVYSGDKLKNWPTIFSITVTLLIVWEKIQYQCRKNDPIRGEETCKEMDQVSVPVLTGLLQAISKKIPSFLEWDTRKHHHLLSSNSAACYLMTEIRGLVHTFEPYLRTRGVVMYDAENPDCFRMRFVSRVLLRDTPEPAEGTQ